ncbi:MAG: response regulator [Candidatus Omnitrophota bacterium]
MSKGIILCVDDEQTVLVSLRFNLEDLAGQTHDIRLAESAEDALQIIDELEKGQMNLEMVIADHVMPGMKGAEFLEMVHKKHPETVKILLTGYAGLDSAIYAINNAGLSKYIEKPWENEDLRLTVKNLLEEYRLKNENRRILKELETRNQELEKAKMELEVWNKELEVRVEAKTRQLVILNKELVRASEAKSKFLTNVSHELRTPLNSVIGFSEVLLDGISGGLNATQGKYLNNILTSGRHLLQLINDLLDLASIEAGKIQVSPEQFFPDEVIKEVNDVVKVLALKKKISLTVPDLADSPMMTADKKMFKQVMYNLLSNAIKFTPEEGSVKIETLFLKDKEEFQISVIDSGIGIKKEDWERIFEPFQQADEGYSRQYSGTGLGLSLVKTLIEIHGGKIWLESEEGKGSKFIFTFPVVYSLDRCVKAFGEKVGISIVEIKKAAKKSAVSALADKTPSILVVEDNPQENELLSEALRSEGYNVLSAFDGEEAVNKARELKPDIVALDINLPKKNGWQVLQELKDLPETKDIPVIVVSVMEDSGEASKFGAIDYLVKPVDKSKLFQILGRFGMMDGARNGKPINILVVDDDPYAVELTEVTLRSAGFKTIKAFNGKEGVELAIKSRPDLMILDLMMPRMSGFKVIEEMKSNPLLKDIPIIVLTAKSITLKDKEKLNGNVEHIEQKGGLSAENLLQEIRRLKKV